MIVKNILKCLSNHPSEEVRAIYDTISQWVVAGFLDKHTDFEDYDKLNRRHVRSLFINIASHVFGHTHTVIIDNVPETAFVPDYDENQPVTPEHIFDTLIQIDGSVKFVSYLGRGCYGALCDNPKKIEKTINGMLLGGNRLRIYCLKTPVSVKAERKKRHSMTILIAVFTLAVFFVIAILNIFKLI